MLSHQHVVTGSKQTSQSMNRISAGWSRSWYSNFCVCYQWEKYGTSAANLIDISHCIVVQYNLNYRRDQDLWSVLWNMISKILA